MQRPPYLIKGDKIAIVAPARKVTPEEMQPAIEILKNWGLEVVLGKKLFHEQNQFSGSDAERADDFQAALDDDSIKAIISARGGYGILRIIDALDFTAFKKKPKWVIGFSDITVLHSHIHNMSVETLHATMPINFTKNADATDSLRKALFGENLVYEVPKHALNKVQAPFAIEGELVGGNLSLLYALAGSTSDIDTNNKILFIEDLDEYLYHIDRMMLNLKRSGKLSNLKALLVGGMTDMKDNTIPYGKTAEEIILDAVKDYSYPVIFNMPAGHIERNLSLYLGRAIKIEISESNLISY